MAPRTSMTDGRNREPYVGRRFFEVADQDIFFGRDRECAELKALLDKNPIVVVLGPAGCGKTSLLQAGLALVLGDEADVLPTGHVSHGSSFPLASLPDHNPYILAVLSSWSPAESRASLAQLSLADFLDERALAGRWSGTPSPIFAVIDQLEEAFSDARNVRQRDAFFEDIATAIRAVPRLRIVLSIRSDAVSELATYQRLLDIDDRAYLPLRALERSAAIEAVKCPMEQVGFRISAGLAEDIVDELLTTQLADRAGGTVATVADCVEPAQIQVVCAGLYQAVQPHVSVLTCDFLDAHDLAEQSLASFCADALTEIAVTHQISVAALSDWLKQTFVSSRGTREFVAETLPATAGMPYSVIRGLRNRHLLTTVNSGGRWCALASDRLVTVVRQLSDQSPVDSSKPAIDAASHLGIAVITVAEGELALAQKHAAQALKAAAGGALRLQADAHSLLGNIAFERGEYDLAEQHYQLAAELSEQLQDQSAVGRLLGAIGRIHAKQGRYMAALEDLQSAVMRLPSDLTLQTELAKVLWHAGQPQAASAVFGTVLNVEPDFAEALAGRGQVRAEHGNASSALDDLRALQRLRPSMGQRPEVRSAYALALARAGRPETAMQEADAALASAPDNGLIFLRAARVANASGAPERATALLRKAEKANDPALSSAQLSEARRLMESVSEPDA